MKKIAIVLMLAVFAPSLVLAWLAVRSVRDQQIVATQQQTLLYQAAADAVAKDVRDFIADRQREFSQVVEAMKRGRTSREISSRFDELLREQWPLAEVGFSVSLDGNVLSPQLFGRPEARQFRLNNEQFLCSREPVSVYWSAPKGTYAFSKEETEAKTKTVHDDTNLAAKSASPSAKVEASPAEFKQLVGDSYEGTVARFLQDKLKLLVWYRSAQEPEIVYGAQLNLSNVVAGVRELIASPESVRADAIIALLDDTGRVMAGSVPPNHKPLVTSEVGHALPHWRVSLSLNDPDALTRQARPLALMLSLIVVMMVAVIAVGGALIAMDLNRQLRLARQKTDFVSNVSHELKTPLTSIRMFSEMLAEEKVSDPAQRKQFLAIIGAEAARLTRLINNVLDFSRMERGEKKYHFERCDLNAMVRDTVATFRPQLEAKGFAVKLALPQLPLFVHGDCDAIAQVLVNLLSNAEKYSADGKEVSIEVTAVNRGAELRVADRGPGVPRGSEEKIFEQFFRAHDSLSSGIQGSGLGLTLARQVVHAHGGQIRCQSREGGGTIFIVQLPQQP